MDTNPFNDIVQDPEPDFLQILSQMPEPPFGSQDRIKEILPEVNRLFSLKKQAVNQGDAAAFDRATDEEAELLRRLEE